MNSNQTPTAATIAHDVIGQVAKDLEAGYLPTIVPIPDFATLHNYVDANEYLIEALDNARIEHDPSSDEQATMLNKAMDLVTEWLVTR